MTTGDAARLLGLPISTMRRRVDDGAVEYTWTNPDSEGTDVRGNRLRGRRQLYVDSVHEYGFRIGRLKRQGGTVAKTGQNQQA